MKPKKSGKKHNPHLAKSLPATTADNKGVCSTAKAQPAAAGKGKTHAPGGRSASAQKTAKKP